MTAPTSIDRLCRRAGDLDRAASFYGGLGFEAAGRRSRLDPGLAAALGCGAGWTVLPLRLGRQRLDLLAPPPGAPPPPPPPAANDPAFQHFAIPVRDMDAACGAVASLGALPMGRGGPQRLPPSSGDVVAFKFRDPDGNPLELILFPAGEAAERWRGSPGLFLGIDHTAVTVSDVEAAAATFGAHGFRPGARGLNRGPEQARLDGLPDPVVDVVTLMPSGVATPHLELLHYREPAFRAGGATGIPTTWTVVARDDAAGQGERPPIRLEAPDGHGLVLAAAS